MDNTCLHPHIRLGEGGDQIPVLGVLRILAVGVLRILAEGVPHIPQEGPK